MRELIITAATEEDLPSVLALNQANVPHVGPLTLEALRELAAQASHFGVARAGEEIAGFILALAPGQPYRSLNYRWFCERYEDFVYVDRLAVDGRFRGQGIGRALYESVERAAMRSTTWLTCEVNLRPPNPDSFAFHRRLGFVEVGQQDTEGGAKRVSLLARPPRAPAS